MSRIRIVEGTMTINTKGDHYMYSEGNIVFNAGGSINETAESYSYSDKPLRSPLIEPQLTTELNGYFYTPDGIYLGKIGSGNNVYITDQAIYLEIKNGKDLNNKIVYFTEKYKLNNEQLLDRANWIFGEGRGEFADDYAHTIQNIKNWGPWGQGYKKESDMYNSMTDGKYSGKDDFFSGNTGYSTYDDFSKARKNLIDLNKLKKANIVIKAIINQQTGVTEDQTPNATQWLGYPNKLSKKEIKSGITETQADKSYARTVKKYGKDKVLRRDGSESGRSHIFYDTRPIERVKQLENKKNK